MGCIIHRIRRIDRLGGTFRGFSKRSDFKDGIEISPKKNGGKTDLFCGIDTASVTTVAVDLLGVKVENF